MESKIVNLIEVNRIVITRAEESNRDEERLISGYQVTSREGLGLQHVNSGGNSSIQYIAPNNSHLIISHNSVGWPWLSLNLQSVRILAALACQRWLTRLSGTSTGIVARLRLDPGWLGAPLSLPVVSGHLSLHRRV